MLYVFNELTLLKMRLCELYNYVDFFVLVESKKTHSGKNKPLHYRDNIKCFEEFSEKIIHVLVDDFPPYEGDPWKYENFQRNSIARGLVDCQPQDLIVVSDVDEIPRPSALKQFKGPIEILENRFFYYKLNLECVEGASRFLISRIVRYKDFRSAQKLRRCKPKRYPWWRIDKPKNPQIIRCGGWHFSYLNRPENIRAKIRAFAHQEYNTPHFTDLRHIEACIAQGRSLLDTQQKFRVVPIDDTFPRYVQENLDILHPWIAPWQG